MTTLILDDRRKHEKQEEGGESMDFLVMIIFGGIAGWIASMVMHDDYQHGLLMNIVLGIVGAVIGGFLFNLFGQSGVNGFNLYSFLVAIFGAVVVIWAARMFTHSHV